MDENLQEKLEQKIRETVSKKDEIKRLSKLLSDIDDSEPFMLGVAVGRLYNAFYYQTRRILGREPTNIEFQEFLNMIKSARIDLR